MTSKTIKVKKHKRRISKPNKTIWLRNGEVRMVGRGRIVKIKPTGQVVYSDLAKKRTFAHKFFTKEQAIKYYKGLGLKVVK